MKKILVTGAAGMVGWHVKELLARAGHTVIPTCRADCDLRDARDTRLFFEATEPTHVIHTAATVYGIMGNMRNQGKSLYENTVINTNVIEAARAVGVTKITAMGTGAVYPTWGRDEFGRMGDGQYRTDDIFSGRPHPSEGGYAHAKRHMLAMLEAYKESYGMDFAYVVSCNLFGPGDKFDGENGHVVPMLVKKFYDAKQSGGVVTIWGDGSAQRDFLYVKDAASAVVEVAKGFSGPINMGSGSVWRIKEIVRTLTKISGLPPDRVVWDASKPNGQDYRAYDLRDLAALGFKPQYSVADGLRETWDWYSHAQEK